MSGRPRRDEGFTLLELVIAMGILAVGLLGIATAQIWAINRVSHSRHLSQALHLAQEQMELFHATPVASLLAAPCAPTPTCDDPANPIQVDVTDATTFVAVTVLLVVIAALAGYFPARRASRIDPMTVLAA